MLSTKSLYPSLHWQKETTATKTTWARCELQVSLAQGLGSSWAWFCAQLQGVKQSHAVLEAAQSCNYPKGSVPATRRGLKLNHGLVPWQGKWCLLEQDVIGRHWRAWQQRGQALPWAELLFQVSHHREESDLKCRDMGREYCVCSTCKCSDSTKPDSTTEVRQGAFKDSEENPSPWKQWKSEPSGFPQAPGYTLNVLHLWLLLVTPKAT